MSLAQITLHLCQSEVRIDLRTLRGGKGSFLTREQSMTMLILVTNFLFAKIMFYGL